MFLGNDLLVSGLMNSTSRLGRMNLNELFLAPSVGPCRGSPSGGNMCERDAAMLRGPVRLLHLHAEELLLECEGGSPAQWRS
jgi:hypothetical protein